VTTPQKNDHRNSRPALLFINRSYWPDVEATGQLLTELCEDLAGVFDVTVICGAARQVVDAVPENAERFREHRGVKIRRVRHTQFSKTSFIGRITNMLTFQMAATHSALTARRADVVIVETDPPFLCILGRVLQVMRKSRLICYLQDIYPDVAIALGKLNSGLITRFLRWIFFGVYRQSDAVIVLSRDMKELLADSGVRAEHIHVIPNWIDTDLVKPVKQANPFRQKHNLTDKFVVMYSGNLGLSQNLDMVLEAAYQLRESEQIQFMFVGDGADRNRLEQIAGRRQLTNVVFVGYQPKVDLGQSLSAADVHLVVLQPQIRRLLMPSKIYGVFASGTAAIVIGRPDCELAQIVRQNDLGQVVVNDDPGQLARTILQMADSSQTLTRQGINAREYAMEFCTRSASVERMRFLCRELLSNSFPRKRLIVDSELSNTNKTCA